MKPVQAILCDLDGVITQTAKLHAEAWKLMFDEFFDQYARTEHTQFMRFDIAKDYPEYIDGKPRLEGIRSYLDKVNIRLPEGTSDDPSGKDTIQGLAKRKNEIFNSLLREEGVEVYQKSVEQLQKWRAKGIKIAVVSSSKNCKNILKSAQIENLFDTVVDGITAEQKNLKGKPEPDTFLYAAKLLDINPADAIVVEDSLAGIAAGKKGKFGSVVGIIHDHDEEALYRSGSDYAVHNLEELAEEVAYPWYVIREGFNPYKERIVESIMSMGNGYFGTRNSLEEDYTFSEQSTYVSGVYQDIPGMYRNELARVPDWTRIQVFLDGEMVDLLSSKILYHKRYLDLKKGLVVREWRSQDKIGRTIYLKVVKYISLHNKNEAFKSISIIPENFSGKIKVLSGIDGKHIYSDILIPDNGQVEMVVNTIDNAKSVRLLQRSRLDKGSSSYKKKYSDKGVFEEWEWMGKLGKEYIIESLVTISSSEEGKYKEDVNNSNAPVSESFFQSRYDAHVQRWEERWKESGIIITGNEKAQLWVNFALYHLINAGEFSGNQTSIGARGLTGTSYQGHVFWDTEMYLLPFYLFTAPEVAKALLLYRYNTLDGARENARREGHKGSCFAWESTDSGLEMSPVERISPYGQIIPNFTSFYEIHITPDIAYAVWQHWIVTQDIDFLLNYGAEIILEAARFCEFFFRREADGLYHIKDVVGPDEYHERIDDNAYTNFMAGHNLDIALKVIEMLNENYLDGLLKVKSKINLQEEEIEKWKEIKNKIYSGYDPETKIYEQFKGYFDLEYIDLKSYEPRKAPMDMLLGERTKRTQVAKQADVLMLQFLLLEKFSKEVIEANYNYYEPRTSHGSSLSPSIHSAVAARLGKSEEAYKYFIKNAEIDLNDNFGNAAGGIHIASIGGTWMSVVMGFAGMYIYEEGLLFEPHLPEGWGKVEIPIQWRNQKINIQLEKNEIKFEITGNKSVNISIGQQNWKSLMPGNTYPGYRESDHLWKWKN